MPRSSAEIASCEFTVKVLSHFPASLKIMLVYLLKRDFPIRLFHTVALHYFRFCMID